MAARNRLASGTSFDDLAKERGLKPADVDLGLVTKSEIIDPAVADAAFSLPSGEISQPVAGKFGVALLKIGKIEPGVEVSYESVAANLKKEIATQRARKSVSDLRDKMEDERGGGASVAEAGTETGPDPRHHRCGRSLRPPSRRPIGRQYPPWPRCRLAGFCQRCRRRQRSDRLSRAGMSGTTFSASRRRASAASTRSRTRSRPNGARTRSRAGCAPRPAKWCRSSIRATSLPTRRRPPD